MPKFLNPFKNMRAIGKKCFSSNEKRGNSNSNQSYQTSRDKNDGTKEFGVLRKPWFLPEIFGCLFDRRKIVEQPLMFPWVLTGFVTSYFENKDSTEIGSGSGILIGPHHALTAAHVVVRDDLDKTSLSFPTEIFLGFGQDKNRFLFNLNAHAIVHPNYLKNPDDERYDIALLKLNENIGNFLGWASLASIDEKLITTGNFQVVLSGYPARKRLRSYLTKPEQKMFYMEGPIIKFGDHR